MSDNEIREILIARKKAENRKTDAYNAAVLAVMGLFLAVPFVLWTWLIAAM